MWTLTVQKNVVDPITEEELLYTYSATAETEEEATQLVCIYASMVEYGIIADKWQPKELAFPKNMLYQFIQPATLSQLESVYPDIVATAYMSAMADVQSYLGAMFNIDAMLTSGDTSSTSMTLRLALCMSTASFVLGSTAMYAETIEDMKKQMCYLLKGLKTGSRNFGKAAIIAEPNVRVTVVDLARTSVKP